MTSSNQPKSTGKRVYLAIAAVLGLLVAVTIGTSAQEVKDKEVKPILLEGGGARRSSIELAGYTRPGYPADRINEDGNVVTPVVGPEFQKFKVMGATIYFAVFKNDDPSDGDTFNTGMKNFDSRFEMGWSFDDTASPRFDKKAKYLYVYQIVNDRNLDPRITQVKGAKENIVVNPLFDPNLKVGANTPMPEAAEINTFAVGLLVDPRWITSWGYFRDSGFAANVVDTDVSGKPIKQVVDDGKKKVEIDRNIRLAFSYLPPIITKLPHREYLQKSPPYSLGELDNGFGIDSSAVNVKDSKSYSELKLVAAQAAKDNIKYASYVDRLVRGADAGKEPDFVQLMYAPLTDKVRVPTIPGAGVDTDEESGATVFRVDYRRARALKQGDRSVVVGFTSDLPPTYAPVRANEPLDEKLKKVPVISKLLDRLPKRQPAPTPDRGDGTYLTSFDAKNHVEAEENANEFFVQGGGGEGGGGGTGQGTVPSPTPAPAAGGGGGGGGISGGMSSLGGGSGGGGSGTPMAMPMPGTGGGMGRGGGIGGGIGGGQGDGGGEATTDQSGRQQGQQIINFKATLINQQAQAQQQGQFQFQNQNQHQNQHNGGRGHRHHGHGDCGGGGNGHVVPAPASLLLGLFGLPGLWFLRRRKPNDTAIETPAVV